MSLISEQQAFTEEIRYIEKRMDGTITSLKTPWSKVNKANVDGWEWGTINLIAAMSGVGKTAMANQLISSVHDCNPEIDIAVLFFTIEMAARRLIGRTISHELGISVKNLYLNSDQTRLDKIKTEIMPKYVSKDINYIETPRTPTQTKHEMDQFIRNRPKKNCLIIYDHTLLVKKESNNSERENLIELLSVMNELKKTYPTCCFLVISQMNRSIESVERVKTGALHYPKKSDIFGSDASYQFSDLVMVLHDPSKLGIKSYGPNGWQSEGLLFLHLLKVRDGDPGKVVIMKNDLKNNKIIELTTQELKTQKFIK